MLAITMGDAAGVGPEILLKAYLSESLPDDLVCIGDFDVLQYCNQLLDYGLNVNRISDLSEWKRGRLNLLDVRQMRVSDLTIGKISAISGAAALLYVKTATQLALAGRVDALVTLPINKAATRLFEQGFTGHTAYIADLCGTSDYAMMLVSDRLIVSHVSTHVPLRTAIDLVRTDPILRVIQLTQGALQKLRSSQRIAVAGLNPHAGEHGAFGSEEIDEIHPAVEKAKKHGWNVTGPLPPDTVFFQTARGYYDAVVCMYHDQGHIPMKVLDFDEGVNVTLGLPIIRTSVDHGTAFDIAYRGIASETSLVRACEIALRLK